MIYPSVKIPMIRAQKNYTSHHHDDRHAYADHDHD